MTKLSTLTALASASCLALTSAHAQNPYSTGEGDYITLSGTVNDVGDDHFTIDYGANVIEVEFEDAGLFEEPAEALYPGDKVTVDGEVEDEFFEGRIISANTVYVRGDSTVYGGDDKMSSIFFVDPYPTQEMTGTYVSLDGEVESIRNREFQLDVAGTTVSVDTAEMDQNPLDDEGRQQVMRGDRVTVVGTLDDNLFDEPELSAMMIYGSDSGSSNDQMSSRNDRSDQRAMNDRRSNSQQRMAQGEDRQNRNRDRNQMSQRDDRNSDRRNSGGNDQMGEWSENEFALIDRNDDDVVTEREYVLYTADADNITRSEAREIFAAISGNDDELTRPEFLEPDDDAEQIFEDAVMSTEGR